MTPRGGARTTARRGCFADVPLDHGCEPNAEVRFEVGGAGIGPTARVVATRDVRAGS